MRTVGESIATTRGQCVVELTIVTRRGLAAQGFFPHHALRLRRIWSSVLWYHGLARTTVFDMFMGKANISFYGIITLMCSAVTPKCLVTDTRN